MNSSIFKVSENLDINKSPKPATISSGKIKFG